MDGRRVRAVASITTEPCRCYDGVCMILWRDLHVAGGTNMQGVRHAASMTACSAHHIICCDTIDTATMHVS